MGCKFDVGKGVKCPPVGPKNANDLFSKMTKREITKRASRITEKKNTAQAGGTDGSSDPMQPIKQISKPRRENFKLPEKSAQDLERLSLESGVTKTEIVRQGIALMRIASEESKQGNRLALVGPDDKVVKELVMP